MDENEIKTKKRRRKAQEEKIKSNTKGNFT